MSTPQKPKVIPPPSTLLALGPLVIVDGDCAYFPDRDDGVLPDPALAPRASRTAFALPGPLSPTAYQAAMHLGMRRSGTLVYRPLCPTCRRCQPFRVDVARFEMSRSQKRVWKRCHDRFAIDIQRPTIDDERLDLYARYQREQHGKDGQAADDESYARFLVDTVADTWELAWRDERGDLVGIGIVDLVDDGLSTVYFFWDPRLKDLSLGVYSALWEIELCKRWERPYYYLGYLVPGSRTMTYKAQFAGGELWHGDRWVPVASRDIEDDAFQAAIVTAEANARRADDDAFRLD